MRCSRLRYCLLVAAIFAGTTPETSEAQALTLIVPFPPGGSADQIGRAIAQQVQQQTGRPVIVENVPGQGGAVGIDRLAARQADGSTVALLPLNVARIHGMEQTRMPTLDVIANVGRVTMAIVAPPSVASDLRSLRKDVLVGHPGAGAASYFCGRAVKSMLGLTGDEVPFKGMGPLVQEMMSGQHRMIACVELPAVAAQISSGRLKALAIAGSMREPTLPGVPTLAMLGVTRDSVWNSYAIVAPAGTPPALKGELTSVLAGAISAAQPQLNAAGLEYLDRSGAASVQSFENQLREVAQAQGAPGASAPQRSGGSAPETPSARPAAERSPAGRTPPLADAAARREAYTRCNDKAWQVSSGYTTAAAKALSPSLPWEARQRAMWAVQVEASTRELAVYENDADCLAVRDFEPYIVTKTNAARGTIESYRRMLGAGPATGTASGRGARPGQDCRASNPNIPVGTCQ